MVETRPGKGVKTPAKRRWLVSVSISFLGSILVYIHLRTDIVSITRRRYISRYAKDGTTRGPEYAGDGNDETRTYRVGCREYPKGGQSCVISGIACIEVRKERTKRDAPPLIYLVDDTRKDNTDVSSDMWCRKKSYSADPRYFGPREWPPVDHFTPRQSCLRAKWRTRKSLFLPRDDEKPSVKWLEEFALVSLDYVSNNHNNHYLKNIIWLLDVILWQRTMSESSTLPYERRVRKLFTAPKHIVFPQSTHNFTQQTSRDVNRLNLALILGMDTAELYRGEQRRGRSLRTKPFLSAYPSAKKRLVFYGDERANSSLDLVCSNKLIVGAQLGNMGHERVCTHLRRESWKLFNITRPPRVAAGGWLRYHRPPRRVILLQRHISRKIRNVEELNATLVKLSERYNFEFEYRTTAELVTAEQQVKFFSRIGVLVTTHGSHAMGGIWMPRHAALIEIFPPGYADFAYDLLARACNLWHYTVQGIIPEKLKEKYKKLCGKKMHSLFDQCVQMKSEAVQAPINETAKTVLHALRRLGHTLKIEDDVDGS